MRAVKIVWYLRDFIWYSLPEITNALLAILGVLMSFPKKAEDIEGNPKLRRIIAFGCIVFGVLGFVASIVQRRQVDSEMRQLVNSSFTQATKNDINSLGDRMDAGLDRVVLAVQSLGKGKIEIPPKPQPKTELPPPEHITYVQQRVPSAESGAPFGLQVIIQTDTSMQPVSLAVQCDGPFEKGSNFVVGVGALMSFVEGYSEDHKTYFIGYQSPPFTPKTPIVITLFSKTAIVVKQVRLNP
jgi:hypothetical protein